MTDEGHWEYEVTWFPPDRPDQVKTGLTEGRARKLADTLHENGGYLPIIARRKVIITEWQMVENYLDRVL